jgi:hypothetical protein
MMPQHAMLLFCAHVGLVREGEEEVEDHSLSLVPVHANEGRRAVSRGSPQPAGK